MAETPATDRSLAKKYLRNMLAECAAFQDAIGAEGEPAEKIAAAKARIHITAYQADSLTRPFAVIMSSGNDANSSPALGLYVPGGDIELRFEAAINANYTGDPENAEIEFENFYEQVMAEAQVLSGQAGYFAFNSWQVIEGPQQYEIEAGVYVYAVRLLINWGLS